MIKKFKNTRAVSLLEFILAVLVFGIAVIPLYYAISYGAKHEIDYEKVGIANKLLESFKDEVLSLDYEIIEGMFSLDDGSTTWKNIAQPSLPPLAFNAIFQAQTEYKDFKFAGEARNTGTSAVKAIEFKASISWESTGPQRNEEIFFVKVKR